MTPVFAAIVVCLLAPAGATPDESPEDLDDSPEWFRMTDETIKNVTEVAKALPDGDEKATRLTTLAELYWQKSGRLHQLALKRFSDKYDDWFARGIEAKVPEPKLASEQAEADSHINLKNAIAIYEYVIKTYPKHSRADEAYLYLAQSHLRLEQKDLAAATLKKLREKYPDSPYSKEQKPQ